MTPTPMSTLSEILTLAGSQFKIYDMGRCISTIDVQDFYRMETDNLTYPAPVNGHARFALCFWATRTPQSPYIWFIQFPVDELGFIKLSCRDQFLDLVINALGKDLQQEPSEEEAEALASNPYVYQPLDDKKAYFNARLKVDLELPASEHYEHAQFYLKGQAGWGQWQTVALQGLADVVARLDQEQNAQMLNEALPQLPEAVMLHLAQLLEHHPLDEPLTQTLLLLHQQQLGHNSTLASLLLRATASSESYAMRCQAIIDYLQSSAVDEQGLIAIAGRLWRDLGDEEVRYSFFETLAEFEEAEQQEPQLFKQLFADLCAIPELRNSIQSMLHLPVRSPALARAFNALTQSTLS